MQKQLLRALGKSGFDFEAVSVFTQIGLNGLVKIIREERRAKDWEAELIAETLDVKPEEIFPYYTPEDDDE